MSARIVKSISYLTALLTLTSALSVHGKIMSDEEFAKEIASAYEKTQAALLSSKTGSGQLNFNKYVRKIQNRMVPAHLEIVQKNLASAGQISVPYPQIEIDGLVAKLTTGGESINFKIQKNDQKFLIAGDFSFSKDQFLNHAQWFEELNAAAAKTSRLDSRNFPFWPLWFGVEAQAGSIFGDWKDLFKPINLAAIFGIGMGGFLIGSAFSGSSTTVCCSSAAK